MNLKSVDKTVIEISKQEIINELINNFFEFTSDKTIDVESIQLQAQYLSDSLKNILSSNYVELFKDAGMLRCLPEEVFEKVEDYFYNDDETKENKKTSSSKIVSFQKEKELEIIITENDDILAKIPENEIQY